MGRQQPRRTMIVADDALYTKRRPSDLPYASPLLESIDEPLVERIKLFGHVCMTLEMLMLYTFRSPYTSIFDLLVEVSYAIM